MSRSASGPEAKNWGSGVRDPEAAPGASGIRRTRMRAAALGLSFAGYVRRLLVEDLEKEPRRADLSAICALGESGRSDISENEGRYIAEAIAADTIPGR